MNPFTLTVNSKGIGTLMFDLPNEKVNKLGIHTLEELNSLLDSLKSRNDIKVLLIRSGKKDIFIAGADLRQFEPAFNDPQLGRKFINLGHTVFNKIAALPFPTVAVINGACLGGGTEFVLSCTYRINADIPKATIALPETQIGLIPGWGGTQRLPRLIGLQKAVEMIASGKSVKGIKAYKTKLTDGLFVPEFEEESAQKFAELILTEKGRKKVLDRRRQGGFQTWLLEKNPIGRKILFSQARKQVLKKTKGFYPAPILAIDTIEKTCTLPLADGLKIEANAFMENAEKNKKIALYLIWIFLGQDELKKQGGYQGELPAAKVPQNNAVIGAGTMGGGISWLFANQNLPIRMKDINWDAVGKGIHATWEVFRKFIRDKKIAKNEASNRFHNLSWTLDYKGFEKITFVVESAVENLDLKRTVYKELEEVLPRDGIIATNTSSLTISDLSRDFKWPDRFIGMHFFNPATRMPLVEIIPGAKASSQTLANTLGLAKKLGKIPLVVGDCNGFLVNRIFMMGANETFYLLEEGTPIEVLDKALLKFGMPMGGAELADEVGIDITYKVANVFEKAYGERMKVPELLKKLYENHFYGKKIGKGFYLSKKEINPDVRKLVDSFGGKNASSENEIIERYMLSMINEASRCLDEKIVSKPDYVDLAMILGTGFPPFRGGVLAYADTLGLSRIYTRLKDLEQIHGARFTPSQLITTLASSKGTFYPKDNPNPVEENVRPVPEKVAVH